MAQKDSTWVDFAQIKAEVTMEMVVKRYGLDQALRKVGDDYVGSCPIHHGHSLRQFRVSTKVSFR